MYSIICGNFEVSLCARCVRGKTLTVLFYIFIRHLSPPLVNFFTYLRLWLVVVFIQYDKMQYSFRLILREPYGRNKLATGDRVAAESTTTF